jgi:hypothetical protein
MMRTMSMMKKMMRLLLALAMMSALLASFWVSDVSISQAQSSVPDPYISMDAQYAQVGDAFSVPILFGTNFQVRSAAFDIHFNPVLLRLDSVSKGDFLSSFAVPFGGGTTFNQGVIDNLNGHATGVQIGVTGLPGRARWAGA